MKIRFTAFHPDVYRKYAPWAALITAFALLVVAVVLYVRDPVPARAPYHDAAENSSVYYSSNENASQENESDGAGNSRNFKNSEPFFTVRAFDNTVAIFEGASPKPLYTIDTPLSRLTEADRELLRIGIRTETLAAAYKLIEDYE